MNDVILLRKNPTTTTTKQPSLFEFKTQSKHSLHKVNNINNNNSTISNSTETKDKQNKTKQKIQYRINGEKRRARESESERENETLNRNNYTRFCKTGNEIDETVVETQADTEWILLCVVFSVCERAPPIPTKCGFALI